MSLALITVITLEIGRGGDEEINLINEVWDYINTS